MPGKLTSVWGRLAGGGSLTFEKALDGLPFSVLLCANSGAVFDTLVSATRYSADGGIGIRRVRVRGVATANPTF
jgi:hypothetical protein